MNRHHEPVSLGALALTILLALPIGLLSIFSTTTTGEQVDLAETVFVGRVVSLQVSLNPARTIVAFDVERSLIGSATSGFAASGAARYQFKGKPAFRVGEDVVVLLTRDAGSGASEVLGQYVISKNEATLESEVLSPVTGMAGQGVYEHGGVSLETFEQAILARRGFPITAPTGGEPTIHAGTAQDPLEPNDSLGTATGLMLPPPTLVTGMPLCVTGLTITAGDLDYFSFDANPLTVLHARTQPPANITGSSGLDTVLGLFDGVSGDLLAVDDDGGEGSFSRLTSTLEAGGPYAVAVASAPDTDFSGDGTTEGPYELKLELELGAYLWNTVDLMAGVSLDGTFIEDQVGFRCIGGQDVLSPGVPADGWSVAYNVQERPAPVTGIFGGAGDQLSDPGFTDELLLKSFQLGGFMDGSGNNRRGFGESRALVTYSTDPDVGVGIVHTYRWSVGSDTVGGDVNVQIPAHQAAITEVAYNRVLDVDLFGTGPDQFEWSFDPGSRVKAFAVDTATNVGNLTVPAQSSGSVTDDMQMALLIEHGRGGDVIVDGRRYETLYDLGFTMVKELASRDDAVAAARDNLLAAGLRTWVVAADQDPDSGTWAAFGAGLSD